MTTKKVVRLARSVSDRALRVFMSAALLAAYVNIQIAAAPQVALAAPAALSVTTSVTNRPLLGGKATFHVTVKNTDTTNKAYNISLADVFSSSRPDPQGVVTFVSATDGNGALVPTSVSTTASTGDMTVKFTNIRDLAPQESYGMDIVVDLAGDATWANGDLVQSAVTAGGNTIPNQTIPDITAAASTSAKVVPIIIQSKTPHQSTGVEQATGTGAARQYYYTIDVQNNYVGPTQSVVVTDTIPDGVEYLGAHAPSIAPTSVSRDASTGVTTLVWNLGTESTSAHTQLAYDTGIRYDYYGTNNGGKNRADATALTTATAGQPIITSASAKKAFTNHAALGGSWLSNPTTDAAAATVTGAALTVAKSSDKTSGGLGTIINYTLTYATSQYYSAIATGGLTLIHDHLPDGQNLDTATCVPAPLSVLHNPDGSTDITWTVGAVANTSGGTIKFAAEVGTNWQEPSYAGDPIVSGDSMVNTCDISGVASDNVNPARPSIPTTSSDSVGFATHLPTINKQMLDPTTHLWSQNVTMTVGDTSTVRVRFNTTDGSTPQRSDINMGNIALTDWLPAGMSIVPGTFSVHYSNASDFTLPTTGTPPPLNISTPASQTIGTVQGVSWYLGNVSPAGWWEATFDVQIDNVPAVQDGIIVANLWKMTGVNTFGTPYSARDMAMCDYAAPHLTLAKTATPPSPLTGGTAIPYTLTIDNVQSGNAEQVSIVDTLPVGMRTTAPSISSVKLDGTTLAAGTDYVSSWDGSTGELKVALQQGPIRTFLPGGSKLKVNYTATVDSGVAANSSLTNTATVGYSTRSTADGRVTPGTSNPADDNTDISTVKPDALKITKSGPSGPFTIGDVFGYDLDVTVPQHEIAYWPSVMDTLTHEGLVPTGTPTITTTGGSPVVAASLLSTAVAYSAGQTKLTFNLADPIDNTTANTAYTFRIHFDVQYTGLQYSTGGTAWEFAPATATDSFTDTAQVAWNSVASAIRQTNSSANSTSVTTNLAQPVLKLVKTILPGGPYVGGSNIDYQLVITNTGGSRAFNPSIADTLPVGATDATITSLALTASTITTPASIASFVATPTMKIVFDPATISIGTTQTLTIKYRVTLPTSLGAAVSIVNKADVNWNSVLGAPAGSRVYNDSPQEAYVLDTMTKTATAAAATIVKRGPAGPIHIGDIVTYSVDATVPANTVAWTPQFTDTLSQRGLVYVSNSATITTRANAPAVPADLGGASTPASSTAGTSTTTLTWTLPSAIDNSGNNKDYGFTLSFRVQVTGNNLGVWDYWPANPSQLITDTAGFKWRDLASGGTQHTIASNNVTTSVTQPLITTTKTILTPGPLAGGQTFDYQVVLANTGYNTAYDVSVNDTLPVEVASATLATATETGVGSILSSATTDFSHLPTNTVSFDSGVSMGTTQTITLVYHCTLSPTVGSGATLTNFADANWSTLPGSVAGERVYCDSAPEGATWTADTTSVSTQTPLVTLGKRIPSGMTTATIGTSVVYSLDATIPANTTAFNMVLADLVPDSLQVIAAVPSGGLPAAVVSSPTAAGTLVTLGPVDWPVAPSASPTTLSVTLFCQVRDVSYSGPPVANGTISNSDSVAWRPRASVASTLTAAAGPVTFNVVQPVLTVSKTALPTSAGPGDLVTFTSVLTNTATSTAAYAPKWRDVLPATMTNPQLLSVKHSGLATLSAGTDYSTSVAGNTLNVLLDQPSSPNLAPGESLTVRFTGNVVGGVHNGTSMTDTATITSYSSLPTTTPPARSYGPVSTTAAVTALSPALGITKKVLSDAYPLQGTDAIYEVDIKNVGTAPALAVVATDTLPADLTYVAGSTSALWPSAGASSTADPSGGTGPTLAWNFGGGATLAAGETLRLVFRAAIDPAAPIGSRINTATTAATDATGAPVPADCSPWISADTSPTDSASVPIRIVKPGVAVAKVLATGGDQFVQVGAKTGFKLTVTNTGDTTLTTVPLTDTYNSSELSYFSASVAPNTSGGGTVKWNNFGSIAPFASKSVNVTFTVLAQPASGIATNYVGVANVVDQFAHTLPSTQDTATVFVTHPAVTVSKSLHAGQDATIQAGQSATYDIAVTNAGDTTLTTVPLTDTYVTADLAYTTATVAPNTVSGGVATWNNLGTLAPGASTTVTVTFTAVASPAGLVSADTARVNGAVDVHGDSPANVNAASSIAITKPQVTVVKTLTSDPQIQVGQTATFKLQVTNSGNTTLTTIPLSDAWDAAALGSPSAAPAGSYGAGSASWTLSGSLAPGASTVVTLTLTALSVPSGQVTTDTATAGTGTDVWGDPAPGGSSSASVRITHPAVAVTKALHAGQDQQVQVGQSVAYDLQITNTGDTTLTTVPLTDTYDNTALTYVSASLAASSVAGGVATWNNTGALAPGASRTIVATFTATAVPSGQVTTDTAAVNSATDQYGDHPTDVNANASVRITAPGVKVVKTRAFGQDGQIQPGQTAAFDLAVTNTGNTDLTTYALTDTWDAATFGFAGATAVPASNGSGTASFNLGPLSVGQTTTVTVTLMALASPGSLTTTDTASVVATDTYGDPAGPSTSSATVMVTNPSVAVLKSLSAGQDPQVQVGQSVKFDLRVTNSGNTPLATIPLSDTYDPTELTYVTATVAPTGVGAGSLAWSDVGPLGVGATKVVTVTFTAVSVPSGQISYDSLASTGTIDTYGDPTPDATSTGSVRITHPAVSVTKTLVSGQDTAVQAGQAVGFDLVVTNTGDTTLTTVPLTDTYDAARLSFSSASPAATTSGGGTAHWNNLGTLAPGASTTVTAHFTALSNPPGQVTTDSVTVPSATDIYGDHPADPNASAGIKITAPSYTLTKTRVTDAAIQSSQTVTFDLTVHNTGDTTLTSVPLSDTWDSTYLAYFSATQPPTSLALGFASWNVAPIAPGATSTVEVTLVALQPVPGLTTVDHAVVTSATDENGDPAVDRNSSATVDITRPELSITKTLVAGQDHDVQVGGAIGYDIRVTNSGDTTLTTVRLADTFDSAHLAFTSASPAPNGSTANSLTWNNLGTLTPGQATTVTVHFTATATGTAIINTAETHGTDVNGDPAPSVTATETTIRITEPSVSVVKTPVFGQDPQIQAGQTASFDLLVTNTGDTTLSTVPLSDTWDPAVFALGSATVSPDATASGSASWSNVGPLAPGGQRTVTITLTALSSPTGLASTDTANVSGTDEFGDPAPPSTSHASVLVTRPDVTVVKSRHAGQDPVIQVGQTVTYDLVVTNSGNTTLTTVPLADAFDSSALSLTTATVAPDSVAPAGSLTWNNLGALAPGATKTVTVTFVATAVPAGQVSVDTASVRSAKDLFTDPAPDSSSAADIRITRPGIAVLKAPIAGQDAAIQAGEPVTFTITVTNTGDTTLTTVPLTDTYDGSVLAFTSSSPDVDFTSPNTLTWNNLGTLNPGQSTTVTVAFSAITAAPGLVTTDTAEVTGATDIYGDHPADVTDTAHVKVTHPALTLAKTRHSGQDPAIQTSQTVTFDLTVANTGDTTLTTVPLTDTWDAGYLLFDSSAPLTSATLGSASWDLAPLAPGASRTVEVTLVAIAPVPGLTTVDTATVVGATDENGDAANDAASNATIDITKPSVAIFKQLHAGQDADIQVGQTVTYDIGVTNTGDTTLTTVPLADTYDAAHLAYVSATPSEDTSGAGVLSWSNLGTLLPGETTTVTVTFSATATGTAITDTALTSGTDVNGDPAPQKDATESTLRITKPGVSVVKTPHFGQDPQIQPGETASFDLLVTNTGDTTLSTVPLSDTWDPAVFALDSATVSPDTTAAGSASWTNVGPLAPGQQTLVTVRLLALSSPTGLVSTDTANVSGTDEFGDPAPPSTSDASVLVTRPDVTVAKALFAGQDPVIQVGQDVTYDLKVTNSGNTTLTTVPLTDTFDGADLSYADASIAPDSTSPTGTLTWDNIGTLAPGSSTDILVTFTAAAVPATQITTDTAAVEGATDVYGDLTPHARAAANVRITHPAVSITKAPIPGQDPAIQAGQPATFTITVTNSGDTTLTTVPLTDTYDGSVLAFTGSMPDVDFTSPNTLSWSNVGPLAPGASATVTVEFSAIKAPAGQVTTDRAAVTGATDEYGDHPADVSHDAQVKVTAPSLSLSKTLATGQDLFIQTGQTVTFHLAVTNTGDTTLTAVPLSDGWDATYLQFSSASSLPSSTAAGLATWDLGPIAPGATASVDLTLIALGPVPAYLTTDTATVTGARDENADPANDDASSASIQVTKPSIAITKQLAEGQDSAIQVGQTVTYDIGVTNIGDITMANVPLSDVFDSAVFAPTSATPAIDTAGAASVSWTNIGPLAAGETTTVTVTFTAVGTSNGSASVDTATVSGATDIHGDGTPSESDTAAQLVTRPHVALTKQLAVGQPTSVRLGSIVTYDLTATNDGDTTLTTVPLADTFDASTFEYVSAIASPSVVASGSLAWDNVAVAPLAPGASVTTQVRMRTLVSGNNLPNLADIPGATDHFADPTPRADATNTVLSVYDPASLAVTKTADPVAGTILLPGQTITYTLGWHNTGGVSMPGVVASDPLPDSVTYVPGSLKSAGTTLTDAVDADAGKYDTASHTVSVNLGDIAAETTGAVTFKVMVAPENVSAKGVYNSAYFGSQESTVATAGPVYHPVDPITIAKVGRDLNGGTLKGGDVIEWTITIVNIGLTQTTHVVITDGVPNTTTYVNGSIRGKGANDAKRPQLSWDIGTMAVGETQVVTFRSTVKQGLPTGTLIKNQAVVSSDQSRPKKSDNPQTPTNGDATILVARTSGSEDWRLPLGAGLIVIVAGMWFWPRRRKLVPQPADREESIQEEGDRNA